MDDHTTIELRRLDAAGVAAAVDWAAREGWDPGLRDAEAFFAADPEGFLGAFVDGALEGTVSAVRYGDGSGFIGLLIVRPDHRNGLLGGRLAHAALDRLGGRTVGIDGVPEHQRQYARLGFVTAWRNVRYRGTVHAAAGYGPGDGRAVVPAASLPFAALAAYDAGHFGAHRDAFLREWLRLPGHTALACVSAPVPGRDTEVRGLGVIRACCEGAKVGPLFADDEEVAEALFRRLVEEHDDVILDTPEANPAAIALAERHGMTPVFETARMYRGRDPHLPAGRIFGVTSFELG